MLETSQISFHCNMKRFVMQRVFFAWLSGEHFLHLCSSNYRWVDSALEWQWYEYRCHLCLGQGWCVIRLQIRENQGPIEDGHTQEVGCTGGKGLLSACCRPDLQDGWDDDNVSGDDDEERTKNGEPSQNKDHHFCAEYIHTGQGQKSCGVTEKVIDAGITECQTADHTDGYQRIGKAYCM